MHGICWCHDVPAVILVGIDADLLQSYQEQVDENNNSNLHTDSIHAWHDSLVTLGGSPILPLKSEPIVRDFLISEIIIEDIIIVSSDENDFIPLPMKQEPTSPKTKKKKKLFPTVSSSDTAPNTSLCSDHEKKLGDKSVIAIQYTPTSEFCTLKAAAKFL